MKSAIRPAGEWIKQAKLLAAEVYPPITECEYDGGFTLFTEDAEEYRLMLSALAEMEGEE